MIKKIITAGILLITAGLITAKIKPRLKPKEKAPVKKEMANIIKEAEKGMTKGKK